MSGRVMSGRVMSGRAITSQCQTVPDQSHASYNVDGTHNASGLRYDGSGYVLTGHVLVGVPVHGWSVSVMASPLMVGAQVYI